MKIDKINNRKYGNNIDGRGKVIGEAQVAGPTSEEGKATAALPPPTKACLSVFCDMGQQKLDWEREEHMDGVGERHMPVKKIWSVALEEVIACETMLRQ
ncbi:hypothetical protein V6N13_043545 [Hibiscus sabdariffa]